MNGRRLATAAALGALVTLGILAALVYSENIAPAGWLLVAIFGAVTLGAYALNDPPVARQRKRRRRRRVTKV